MSYQGAEEAPLVHPEAREPVAEQRGSDGLMGRLAGGWRLAAALGVALLLALLLAGGLMHSSQRHSQEREVAAPAAADNSSLHSHPRSHGSHSRKSHDDDDNKKADDDSGVDEDAALYGAAGASPRSRSRPSYREGARAIPSRSGGGDYRGGKQSIINSAQPCDGPYPGYPYCQEHMDELSRTWNVNPGQEAYFRSKGVDGSKCSMLTYLNLNGFYCPEAADVGKEKIRGVNLGGWLVLEPWITPSLFEQFDAKLMIEDHWKFCEHLGKKECRRQMEKHWDSWVTKDDLQFLADSGINHVRIPFGYWLFGDVRADEPWVTGDLPYLERAVRWAADLGMHVILDLHAAPGSQNGFDNSGRKGEIHFADEVKERYGRVTYPNIRRALEVIANVTAHFSTPEWSGTVVGIELVNEAFVTIPIEVVKDYYLQGYEIVKAHGDTMAVIIGDSFRFGAWNDFMFPPHYRHVWIDTHIYQMFDSHRLSMSWWQHLTQTCTLNKAEVSVAPLSTMVGEWSLATTDCAKWLNGYNTGARFDGTFPGGQFPSGSCVGQDDLTNTTIWTPEYKHFLQEYASKQMDAYESGSSEGWFFWNFKTEKGAFQWNYILGVQQGWIPKDLNNRPYKC